MVTTEPPSYTPTPTARPLQPTTTSTSTATVLRVTVSAVPATLPDYDRHDWKHWTDADGDCQNARNEVLISESRTMVAYRTDEKCRVATGEWLAPYSNTIVTDPGKLDVDHMVPLGNAHDSGAWNWSANRKEQYANYLEDPQHLIAVTASARRSKGARGPDRWKPEDRTYWCQTPSTGSPSRTPGNSPSPRQNMTLSCRCFAPATNRPAYGFPTAASPACTAPQARQYPVRPQQQRPSSTAHATRHRRLEKREFRGAKEMGVVSQHGWRPVREMETETGTASCAKDNHFRSMSRCQRMCTICRPGGQQT